MPRVKGWVKKVDLRLTVRLGERSDRGIEIGERHGVLAAGMTSRERTAASRSARGVMSVAASDISRSGQARRARRETAHPAAPATTPQELRVIGLGLGLGLELGQD